MGTQPSTTPWCGWRSRSLWACLLCKGTGTSAVSTATRLPRCATQSAGSTGIAVGMATKIPPHNVCEIVAALKALIQNPDITLDELLQHVPAPDFPTGGLIM